jgi:DNA helicase-2/ATP-dependent DNA helicase PcrA
MSKAGSKLGSKLVRKQSSATTVSNKVQVKAAERTAAEIGQMLQHDADEVVEKLNHARVTYNANFKNALTKNGQKLVQDELARIKALETEPYFGWLRVREDGLERCYRIGKASCPDARVVAWTHDLAKYFYDAEPGDDYERAGAGGKTTIEGELLEKAKVSLVVENSAPLLKKATWQDSKRKLDIVRLRKGDFGDEQEVLSVQAERAVKEVISTGGLSEIFVFITREQYRLIAHAHDKPLIIQGKAGSGKTTVAMHRLAWLARPLSDADTDADTFETRQPIDPSKILIVMFNKALESFVKTMCEPLGLASAELRTFHSWAQSVIQRFYKGALSLTQQPPHLGRQASKALKPDIGMLAATEAYVKAQEERVRQWLKDKLKGVNAAWFTAYNKGEGLPLQRLTTMRTRALSDLNTAKARGAQPSAIKKLETVYSVFDGAVKKLRLFREDLHKLLTDHDLLAQHLTRASASQIEQLGHYQRALQKGDKDKVLGPEIDFDDLALLLRLMQLKLGGLPSGQETTFQYEHVMIDEAQDFGAVPLRVLLDAVQSRTGVTIVGDINQKIFHGVEFVGWDGVAQALGLASGQVQQLTVGHRSSKPIMRLADWLIGLTDEEGGFSGDLPIDVAFDEEADALEYLTALLIERYQAAPNTHLCVVCDLPDSAKQLEAALSAEGVADHLPLRYGHNKDFTFAPGVTVTSRLQVKGLEFDTVIVWGVSDKTYPDTEQGRRDLYVVVSRAQHKLCFVRWGNNDSSLLRKLEADGLLKVSDERLPDLNQEDLDEPF